MNMTAAEIKHLLESPIWMEPSGEVRQYFRREEPLNIERRPGPMAAGAINTDLRWGQSLATRGLPEIYTNTRRLASGHDLTIYHIYRRKTGEKGPSVELLNKVKSLDYPGAPQMIAHAASYLERFVRQHKLTATLVVPAPSTRPLASTFAAEVARMTGATVAQLFDKTGEAKKMHASNKALRAKLRPGAEEEAFDQDIILVDDLSTKDMTLTQMAEQLWSLSEPRSVRAIVLIGRS